MSSNGGSSATRKPTASSERSSRTSPSSSSSTSRLPVSATSSSSSSGRRPPSADNPSAQVASALGEGSPAGGSSTKVYVRPQPPSRTPRKSPTRPLNPPGRTMSTPTRVKGDAPALLTPEPERMDDDIFGEDGTPYDSRGEALFERVWRKYDPNQLGSIKASDIVDVLTRIEVEGHLPRDSFNPPTISGPLSERARAHRTSNLTRDQVCDWYRDVSNGKELLGEINEALNRAPRPMSPMSLGPFGGLSQMSGFPLGSNDMSYNPYDDLDQPTGPFVGVSTPRRQASPAPPGVLSPRMAALQLPQRMYSEAEYEHLRKENERLLTEMEDITARYESKVKNRENQLSQLESEVANKDKQMVSLQQTIENLTSECQKQKERAEKADDHTNYVEGHADKLQKLVNQHKSVIEDAQDKVKRAETDSSKKDAKISQLSMQINSLKGQLDEKEAMYKKAHSDGYRKAKEELTQGMGQDEALRRVAEAEHRADLKDESNALLKKRNQEARFKIEELEKQVAELSKVNGNLNAEVRNVKRNNAAGSMQSPDTTVDSQDDDDELYAPRGDEHTARAQRYPYQQHHIGQKGMIQENVRMDYTGRDVQTNMSIPPQEEEDAVTIEAFVEDRVMASFETLRRSGAFGEEDLEAIVEESTEESIDSETREDDVKKDLKEASTETEAACSESESGVQTDTPPPSPVPKRPETTDSATAPKTPEIGSPDSEILISQGGFGSNMLGITTLAPNLARQRSSSSSSSRNYNIITHTTHNTTSAATVPASSNPDNYTEILSTTHSVASTLQSLLSQQTLSLSDVQHICAFISEQSHNQGLLAACWQLSRPAEQTLRRIIASGATEDSRCLKKALYEVASAEGPFGIIKPRGWGWAAKLLMMQDIEGGTLPSTPSATAPSTPSRRGTRQRRSTATTSASATTNGTHASASGSSSNGTHAPAPTTPSTTADTASNNTTPSKPASSAPPAPTPSSPLFPPLPDLTTLRSTLANNPAALLRIVTHYLFLFLCTVLVLHNVWQYYRIRDEQHAWTIANRVDGAWGGRESTSAAGMLGRAAGAVGAGPIGGGGLGAGCYTVCGGEGLGGWRWRGIVWEWLVASGLVE